MAEVEHLGGISGDCSIRNHPDKVFDWVPAVRACASSTP